MVSDIIAFGATTLCCAFIGWVVVVLTSTRRERLSQRFGFRARRRLILAAAGARIRRTSVRAQGSARQSCDPDLGKSLIAAIRLMVTNRKPSKRGEFHPARSRSPGLVFIARRHLS